MSMHPCGECRRHLDDRDDVCRFCGAAQPPLPRVDVQHAAARLSRAAVFAGLTACWTGGATPQAPRQTPIETSGRGASDATEDAGVVDRVAVSGVVVDRGTGSPLEGVVVDLDASSGRIAATETNAKGEYKFKRIAPGEYELVFRYATSGRSGSARHVLKIDAEPARVDITMVVYERSPVKLPYGAPPTRRRVV